VISDLQKNGPSPTITRKDRWGLAFFPKDNTKKKVKKPSIGSTMGLKTLSEGGKDSRGDCTM